MKKIKFTLIELLAVMLIFGILASIGLSIQKPSPVKSNLSALIGSIQLARADAIENRRISYIGINTTTNEINFWYQDPYTETWLQRSPINAKAFDGSVSLTVSRLTNNSWRNINNAETPTGIFFDSSGKVYNPAGFASDGWNGSHASGIKSHSKTFAIYDSNNKKNCFLLVINKVGSYEIFEGTSEFPSGYSTSLP